MAEITYQEDYISDTGWVKINVVGVGAIKEVISRLPQNEPVCWCAELHIGKMGRRIYNYRLSKL